MLMVFFIQFLFRIS